MQGAAPAVLCFGLAWLSIYCLLPTPCQASHTLILSSLASMTRMRDCMVTTLLLILGRAAAAAGSRLKRGSAVMASNAASWQGH
jgi:hypothetical protein